MYKKQFSILYPFLILLFVTIYLQFTKYSQLFQFFLWMGIIGICFSKRKQYLFFFSHQRKNQILLLLLSLLFILCYFLLGFFTGYQQNPYQHTFLGIFKNTIFLLVPLIGIEAIRSILINQYKQQKLLLQIILFFLFAMEIPYKTLIPSLAHRQDFFQFLAGTILPLLFNHLFASYLASKTNSFLSIPFRTFETFATFCFPILPALDWYMTGSFQMLKCLFFYLVFTYSFSKDVSSFPKQEKSFPLLTYAFVLIFATFFVCFMKGFFTYSPIAILSNSMYPTFERGDIVIVKKVDKSKLQQLPINTIIIYELNQQYITHRIVKIIHQKDHVFYLTKGDANQGPDFEKVSPTQIMGVYTCHFKYIGFPSIWFNQFFQHQTPVVEVK